MGNDAIVSIMRSVGIIVVFAGLSIRKVNRSTVARGFVSFGAPSGMSDQAIELHPA